ncbi:MAG: ribonuclease P protein component [Holosporales bacterium]|jgi:ribonuclease P protein component|nr:ribonuclease P protein component [Holosporales bacterium]
MGCLGPELITLRKRFSFEKARRSGVCFHCELFLLQAYSGGEHDASPERVSCGITVSRKVGSAIHRNRAKRRLRVALRTVLVSMGCPGQAYVVVARRRVEACSWAMLLQKLRTGVLSVNERLSASKRSVS